MQKLVSGIVGIILGLAIIAYNSGYKGPGDYATGRQVAKIFAIAMFLAGVVYLILGIMEVRNESADRREEKRRRMRGNNSDKPRRKKRRGDDRDEDDRRRRDDRDDDDDDDDDDDRPRRRFDDD
jgi:hypothetical protein